MVRAQPGHARRRSALDISTISHPADKPAPLPENAIDGLMVHLALAAGLGTALALLAPLARALVPFLLGFAGSEKRVPARSSSRATTAGT